MSAFFIDSNGSTYLKSSRSKEDMDKIRAAIEEALDSTGLVLISNSDNTTEHRMKVDDFVKTFMKELSNGK